MQYSMPGHYQACMGWPACTCSLYMNDLYAWFDVPGSLTRNTSVDTKEFKSQSEKKKIYDAISAASIFHNVAGEATSRSVDGFESLQHCYCWSLKFICYLPLWSTHQVKAVIAAAAVAQSVKRPGLRSLKRGATKLTWVRFPVEA